MQIREFWQKFQETVENFRLNFMGIMKYFHAVRNFFCPYKSDKEENKILEFLETIADTIVISWFTFDTNKLTYSFKYINDNFWV